MDHRTDYKWFRQIPTRWMDNDVYGHVNNVVYYAYFDTVVNLMLIERGILDIARSPLIGLCVESQCSFKASFTFPETIDAALRIGKLGNSSIRYEIGLFKTGEAKPAALGYFVHVFVDRTTRRPVPLPQSTKDGLGDLLI